MNPTGWWEWYQTLDKPSWTPSPSTIGTIWQILYPIIFFCLIAVTVQVVRGKIPPLVLLPFVVNLVANLIFTPIQFGWRNLPLATLDIFIVWLSIIWMSWTVWRYAPWISVAQIPYFVWVSIATVLQCSITWRNLGR